MVRQTVNIAKATRVQSSFHCHRATPRHSLDSVRNHWKMPKSKSRSNPESTPKPVSAPYPVSESASAFAKRARLSHEETDAGSIIYEVSCTVDAEVAEEFYEWLKLHAAQLVSIRECRFTSAEIFECEDVESAKKLYVVTYRLEDRQGLQQYLDVHAAKLRGDGKRFAGKLSITRRIMKSAHSVTRYEVCASNDSDDCLDL